MALPVHVFPCPTLLCVVCAEGPAAWRTSSAFSAFLSWTPTPWSAVHPPSACRTSTPSSTPPVTASTVRVRFTSRMLPPRPVRHSAKFCCDNLRRTRRWFHSPPQPIFLRFASRDRKAVHAHACTLCFYLTPLFLPLACIFPQVLRTAAPCAPRRRRSLPPLPRPRRCRRQSLPTHARCSREPPHRPRRRWDLSQKERSIRT